MSSDAGDGSGSELPPGIGKTLAAAADVIRRDSVEAEGRLKSIFPDAEVTGQAVAVSHLISEADIVRLRHAAAGKLSPWVEAAWGALIGTIAPFAVAVMNALYGWSSPAGYQGSTADIVALSAFVATLPLVVGLTLLNKRGTTVDEICDKIERRPRYSNGH